MTTVLRKLTGRGGTAEIGASEYGLVGGSRLRWRPPTEDEYIELANLNRNPTG